MIEASQQLGQNIIDSTDDATRKDRFLKSQAIVPQPFDDKNARGDCEIVINLNTKNNQIDVSLGDELIPQNRDKFFAFELLGRRSRKIYFSSNNLYYHLISLDEVITYIKENMKNRYPDFAQYLIELRSQFYKKDDKTEEWFLNPDKLEEGLKKKFYEYSNGKNTKKVIEEAFTEVVSKEILGSGKKNFAQNINICTLTIDGIRAHEKDFPFYKEYIDIVYYERQKRFFESNESKVRENGFCPGCQKQKKVTGKIDIPTKFYITDKPTFYEELKDKNAYRSFALCEECYQELMIGIDHIQNKFADRLFGTNYYLIPRTQSVDGLNEKMIVIKQILGVRPKNLGKELRKHSDLIEEMRQENLRFDFLFHWTPPGQGAAFVIAEYISDVEYKNLDSILKTIRGFESGFYSTISSFTVGLSHIYWLLFPNRNSHSSYDPNLYRKELLQIFKALVKDGVLLYRVLLNKFLFIHRKIKHRQQQVDVSFMRRPLQMHMLLSLFYQHTNLQGLDTMDEQKTYTEIPDEKISEFFETHDEVYQENHFRQGLVLLGILMNQVYKKQKKQGKSSTVLDKLNFDGMPVRRLSQFINEITEYLNMRTYDLYQVNSVLHAAMIDRLQNIENSSISKDEVVFYIMTGISLSSYLGYQYNQEKQMKEVNHE